MLDDFIISLCLANSYNKNKADYAFVKIITVSLSIIKRIGEYIG